LFGCLKIWMLCWYI